MRVAFFGNVANCLFQMAQALREDDDVDAHLFVSRRDPITGRPEGADPALASGYPDWIHDGDWITPSSVLAPWRAPITHELARFDLVVVSGPGPIFAQFAGRPWCWWVSGGDLTVKPFPVAFWRWYDSWSHRAGELIGGAWQRRAARRADRVWIQPFAPMTEAAARLRIPSGSLSDAYFPLVVDTAQFAPDVSVTSSSPDLARVQESPFVVFHPSRMLFRETETIRRAGQIKRNDVLLRGFAQFVSDGRHDDALLVIPDIRLSRDLPAAKELVRELGIEHAVVWATPPEPSGFPRHDLLAFYQAADVVVDEFGVGWFGFVALEGVAMAKPVVTYVDDAVMAKLYEDGHPFCNARTPDDVAARFEELAADPALRAEIGGRGRRWVVQHHSPEAVRVRYVREFRRAVADVGVTGPE